MGGVYQVLDAIFKPVAAGRPPPTIPELTALPFFAAAANNFNRDVFSAPMVCEHAYAS
jgi:hypothetical protein